MQNSTRFFLATLFSLTLCNVFFAAEEEFAMTPRPMKVGIRYTTPTGIGYNRGYTTLEGFFTSHYFLDTSWLPFLDLRGHVFDNSKIAANAGVGARYLAEKRVWGMNVYYDYRNTSRQHYNQVAAGFESLGRIWDFRLNGYLPVGKKNSPFYRLSFDSFKEHSLIVSRLRKFAMGGFNAEASFHLDHFRKAPLTFAAGPYYLVGSGKVAWGGELKAGIELFDRYISLEGHASYDHFFKWAGQGQISINFSFGGKKEVSSKGSQSCALASVLQARAHQRVDRHEIIPVGKKKVLDVAEGLVFVFVDNLSHSSGTFEDPYHSLAQAQDGSAPGDIIYVFPGDGTDSNYDMGITLKDDQQLLGASSSYTFATNYGSVLVPPQASLRPTLSNQATIDPVVILANGNTVAGLNITDTKSDKAINGDHIVGFTAFQNTITSNQFGASFSNSGGEVILTNNQIVLPHSATIAFHFQNTTPQILTVSNNTIEGGGLANIIGVDIEGDAPDHAIWTFTGNSFSDLGVDSTGFYFPSLPPQALTFSNNTVEAREGVSNLIPLAQYGAAPDNATWSFTGNSFRGIGSMGFDIEGAPLNLTLSNNTLSVADGVTGSSIVYINGIVPANAIWEFSGNTITNNGESNAGFSFVITPSTLTLSNNTFLAAGSSTFVQISGDAQPDAAWSFTGNTFSEVGNSGIGFIFNGISAKSLTLSNNKVIAVDASHDISAIYVSGDADTDATWNFTGNTFTGFGNAGRGFDIEGNTPQTFILSNNTMIASNTAGVQYGILITNDAPANAVWNFTGNTFTGVENTAFQIYRSPAEILTISNNTIATSAGATDMHGVYIQSTTVPANATWNFNENIIAVEDLSYGFMFDTTSIASGGETNWTFDQNTVTIGGSSYGIAIHDILPNGLLITNNTFTGVSGGSSSAIASSISLNQPGYSSCLTLTNNVASPVNPGDAGAYQLSQSDGTFNLNASGNTGQIGQSGTIGSCP